MSELGFEPEYFTRRDDGRWVLRRNIALTGPEGRSQMGLQKATSEAERIEGAGGLVAVEPNPFESSLSTKSLSYLSNALTKREN